MQRYWSLCIVSIAAVSFAALLAACEKKPMRDRSNWEDYDTGYTLPSSGGCMDGSPDCN